MSRQFDIIIYGCTGFTGKKVVKYLHDKHPSIKIALAGRDQEKLSALAQSLGLPSTVGTFVAPTPPKSTDYAADNHTDYQNLKAALSKADIVIACAGPFNRIGESIVSAAVDAKTHYLDICGEPQFFDDMLAKYDKRAQANNTLILSACGFDSVPADLSAQLAMRQCRRKYGKVTNLEIIHTFQNISCANPTTYHAAVDGFHSASKGDLKKSRENVKKELGIESAPKPPKSWPKIIEKPGTTPVYHKETNTYLLKFMGSDASCVLATDRYLRYRNKTSPNPVEIDPHPNMSISFGVDSKSNAYKVLGYGAVFSTLARFEAGCKILHSNPALFTNNVFREGGPTEEEIAVGSFKTYCTAYGMDEKESVKVVCSGPEPGYVATPQIIVALALMIKTHKDEIQFNDGGVMVPGVAFGKSDTVYKVLSEEGIDIKVQTDSNSDDAV